MNEILNRNVALMKEKYLERCNKYHDFPLDWSGKFLIDDVFKFIDEEL